MATLDICPIFCSFFLKALLKCLDGKAILYIISCITNISFLLHLKKLTPPCPFKDQKWLFSVKRGGGGTPFYKSSVEEFMMPSLCPLLYICVIDFGIWSNFLCLWPFLLSQLTPKIIKNFAKFHKNINNV